MVMNGKNSTSSKSLTSSTSSDQEEEKSLILVDDSPPPSMEAAPLISSYKDNKIRPLLDAVDKLRALNLTKLGIKLPTIVVVGDQSSGKSSVLESLAGINLPRGQGICTRVPLIMRLENNPVDCVETELCLKFHGKTVHTNENHVSEAIYIATNEIAGTGKWISQIPLTLHVKKHGVPDLTMVDLPGITRVPVHGQPDDIYEQISAIIMEYISPQESIILNVLSATVDFPTCESISMSQKVDKKGVRTLAVVTKADKAPDGLLEKVTCDDVNIGLGYVCVRNRIGDESYEEARKEEALLFQNHHLLSKLDKSIVGVPVLAQKLVQIQSVSLVKFLPEIVRDINLKLVSSISELGDMPKQLSSFADFFTTFMCILNSVKESMRKLLLAGVFDEYPDDKEMHCTARLRDMVDQFAVKLNNSAQLDTTKDFLMEEIEILEEAKRIMLPNFLPPEVFLAMLRNKVDGISEFPIEFVNEIWDYLGKVIARVINKHSETYPQFQSKANRAAHTLITRMKSEFLHRVKEIVEMDRMTAFTSNPEYVTDWKRLLGKQDLFISHVSGKRSTVYNLEGFGEVKIEHLWGQNIEIVKEAFDLKMRMQAYWKIVILRMVDSMALLTRYTVNNLVTKEMETDISNKLLDGRDDGGDHINVQQMLVESSSICGKRKKLEGNIGLLKEAREVLANVTDKFAMVGS